MTLFAHVVDGAVVEWGSLPDTARRLDTGEVIYDLPGAGARWAKATGWLPVVESTPPDAADGVPTFAVELVDGVPVQVWSVRPLTAVEEMRRNLAGESDTFRLWAVEAEAVSVSTNAARLGVLFDRFADLIDLLEGDET